MFFFSLINASNEYRMNLSSRKYFHFCPVSTRLEITENDQTFFAEYLRHFMDYVCFNAIVLQFQRGTMVMQCFSRFPTLEKKCRQNWFFLINFLRMISNIEQPIDSPFFEIKIADNTQGNIRTPANIILVSEGRFAFQTLKKACQSCPQA